MGLPFGSEPLEDAGRNLGSPLSMPGKQERRVAAKPPRRQSRPCLFSREARRYTTAREGKAGRRLAALRNGGPASGLKRRI
jgi:hypothetical protein